MNKYWDVFPQIGEMMGSLILSFGVLVILYFAKKESFGLNTNLKRRVFLGASVPLAVILGLIATKGFGGHGQINPAITLMVAGIENQFEAVPATIGFQLIGAIMAFILFIITIGLLGEWRQLEVSFNFINQSAKRTIGIEIIGNMFWLIPISAMVVAYLPNAKDARDIDFYQLALSAAFGKMLLVGIFEDFGAANFNAQIWLAKFLTTLVVQKKISQKQLCAEMSGLVTTLGVGAALGPFGRIFYLNTL